MSLGVFLCVCVCLCVSVCLCDDGMRVGVGLGGMFLTPPLPTSPSCLVNLESSMWISGNSAIPVFDRTPRFLQSI